MSVARVIDQCKPMVETPAIFYTNTAYNAACVCNTACNAACVCNTARNAACVRNTACNPACVCITACVCNTIGNRLVCATWQELSNLRLALHLVQGLGDEV
eukprot:1145378-Pelagomonas_calceolata.AAC.8